MANSNTNVAMSALSVAITTQRLCVSSIPWTWNRWKRRWMIKRLEVINRSFKQEEVIQPCNTNM